MKKSNTINRDIKVIIAEDDFLVSEMVEGELLNAGYEVIAKAADGKEAVELTKSLKPDVIIMDIRMPGMTGLEASREIMENCPTPVIILTAYENIEMVKTAGSSGVGAYLTKPLDIRELERAILIARERFKDIKELREKNLQLEKADILNRNLMKEIHHRVKNNFQLISSLLNLQIGGVDNSAAGKILEAARDRVLTLALLHESLYEVGDFVTLPMEDFITDLLNTLVGVYSTGINNIELNIKVESIVLDTKKAVTIGLILNEAVTNSIKYAFQESARGRNLISISMKVDGKNIVLSIVDNGIGISDIEVCRSGDTLGMQLIHLLTESQLEGDLEFPNTEGFEILIRFKP